MPLNGFQCQCQAIAATVAFLLHCCSLGLFCRICFQEQLAHLPRQAFQGTEACVCGLSMSMTGVHCNCV